jgi:hypothetical protein
MKRKHILNIFLLVFIAIIIVVSGLLLKQANDYKTSTRQLILQNDSLRAVIIELNKKVEASKPASSSLKKRSTKEK